MIASTGQVSSQVLAANADLRVDQVLLNDVRVRCVHRRTPCRSNTGGRQATPVDRPRAGMRSVEADVFEIDWLTIDSQRWQVRSSRQTCQARRPAPSARQRRRGLRRWATSCRPLCAHSASTHHTAIGRDLHTSQGTDLAVEGLVRRDQPERNASLLDHLVPATHTADRVADVVIAQNLIQRVEHRHFALDQPTVLNSQHRIVATMQAMVVVTLAFFKTPLQTGVVEDRRVARFICTEEIDGHAEVEFPLQRDHRSLRCR